jgi:hypothetical protein
MSGGGWAISPRSSTGTVAIYNYLCNKHNNIWFCSTGITLEMASNACYNGSSRAAKILKLSLDTFSSSPQLRSVEPARTLSLDVACASTSRDSVPLQLPSRINLEEHSYSAEEGSVAMEVSMNDAVATATVIVPSTIRCRRPAAEAASSLIATMSDNSCDDSLADSDYAPDNVGLESDVAASPLNIECEQVDAGDWMQLQQSPDAPPAKDASRCRTAKKRIERNIVKYKLLAPCSEQCRRQCRNKIDDEHREAIRVYFWSKSFAERRLWLNGHVVLLPIHQKKVRRGGRSQSVRYYLNGVEGAKVIVCKKNVLEYLGT